MSKKTKITCPNCGMEIDVQDIISHKLLYDGIKIQVIIQY